MKKARTHISMLGCAPVLQIEQPLADGTTGWRKVYCPLSSSSDGDPCGEWCVWFDVDVRDCDASAGLAERKLVTCKGTPIAELVDGMDPVTP
jgi:hypothetical protein